jgi:hypothetical protein
LIEPAGADTVLAVGELIGNAIAHTATPATLTLSVAEGSLEVAVADTAPRWIAGIPREAAGVMIDDPASQRDRESMRGDLLDQDRGGSVRGCGRRSGAAGSVGCPGGAGVQQ